MKLLVGLRIVSASGSSNDSEGFSTFSISTKSFEILASGTEKKIKDMVKKAKDELVKMTKELNKLEDKLNDFESMSIFKDYKSDFDYDKEYKAITKKYKNACLLLPKFEKLMIIDGELI